MKNINNFLIYLILFISTVLAQDNYSLSFDGSDYVVIDYTSGQITSEISIMAWVDNNEIGNKNIIYNGCCGTDATWYWMLRVTNQECNNCMKLQANVKTDLSANNHISPDGNDGIIDINSGWHHVAMTYADNVLKLFLDGNVIKSAEIAGNSLLEGNDLNIGGWSNGNNSYEGSHSGGLDDVAVFNRALSTTEITNYMNNSLTGQESGLVGYWNFNEGSGISLDDVTSNNNDGTINGATWSTDGPNFIPVASAVSRTTAEDTDFSGSFLGSDANGDDLTYAIASNPSNGTVTLNSASAGTFTYSPAANYNGSDTFTFTVNDGSVTSSAATVTMTITAVNDSPVASNVTGTTVEDTDYSGTLSGSDVDGDDLTYAIASNPSNGTVTLTSATEGTFTYSPSYNYYGTDTFTYTVNDGTVTSSAATVTITVTAVIDKFYISSGSGSDNNNGSSNSPFATIQAGINVSDDSDTIFVAAGTYTENINFNGKAIYLKGAATATTILDGGQNASTVKLIGGEGSGTTIRHFTLKNGSATYCGGVLVNNSSNLNLLDVIITGNSADYGAGVSVSDNSNVTIKNALLHSNQSDIQGGGLYLTESSQVTVTSSTVAYNAVSGNSGSASGNGISIGTASSLVSNSSIIWGNRSIFF